MRVLPTSLPGVSLIEPRVFEDARGYLYESWADAAYAAHGIAGPFVQDSVSMSKRSALRGLHLQHPHAQAKLVHVLLGEVFDVCADVRVGSPTFGQWVGVTLSERNRHQLHIPVGFAHGFCVTSERALVVYKCSARYHPEAEVGIAWNDPDLAIEWPVAEPDLSEKDAVAPRLADLTTRLPRHGVP